MKLILTGGKTGGHIYPLLRLKDMVYKNNNNIEIIYYGLKNSLEEKIVKKESNIEFRGLDIPKDKFKLSYFSFYYKEYKRVKKELQNEEVVVVSTGGFVSLVLLIVCRRLKIKYILLEENKVLGRINKLFYKKSYKLCLTFPIDNLKKKNVVLTGNPSSEFKVNENRFLLDKKFKYILVIGGSGGSSILTKLAVELEPLLKEGFKVILIASKTYKDIKDKQLKNLIVYEYVDNLYDLINKCDYIVLRAGSSTLCETLALEKCMIVIPSLTVKDNHQYHNAKYLLDNNSCILLDENNLSSKTLNDTILSLDKDIQKRSLMKVSMRRIKIDNPCKNVYYILKDLL